MVEVGITHPNSLIRHINTVWRSSRRLQVCFLPASESADLECMQIPSIRAVVLIRFGPRRKVDRRFEAVATIYRRGADRPFVADAVIFGTVSGSSECLQKPGLQDVYRDPVTGYSAFFQKRPAAQICACPIRGIRQGTCSLTSLCLRKISSLWRMVHPASRPC